MQVNTITNSNQVFKVAKIIAKGEAVLHILTVTIFQDLTMT